MPNIIVDKQSDWGGNFKLRIQSKTTNDTSDVYIISSSDNGVPIGFELHIPRTIKEFGNGVIFKSLGNISDNFLKTLYSIYGLNLQENLKFVRSMSCNYAGLNDIALKGNGQPRLKGVNYIKVFLEGVDESEYAEFYLNIDEASKTIEFEEKDFDYRPYVAMLLTEEYVMCTTWVFASCARQKNNGQQIFIQLLFGLEVND